MKLSVIIPHFYRERERNLRVIVDSLISGSWRPDEILIWNNEQRPITVGGALVIDSPRNVGAQARVIAALMARGERILFLDNDVAVRSETVLNLLDWSVAYPDSVVTLEGRQRPPFTPYSRWPKIYGHGLIDGPRQVFLSLGRGEMVVRDVLLTALQYFPFSVDTRMDDLWLSHSYEKAGVPVYVVPCGPGVSDLVDLPMGGVGMCKEPGFYEERNRVVVTIAHDQEALKQQAESA